MNATATTFAGTDTSGPRRAVPKILGGGGGGASAGTVIPELANRGAHVRGLIHERRQTVARNQGAAEIPVADSRERGEHGPGAGGDGHDVSHHHGFLPQ
jgi:hypothetical protein